MVSDVEAVQDLLLRVVVPGAAAAVGGGWRSPAPRCSRPAAAAVLAGRPARRRGRRCRRWPPRWPGAAADRVAPLRGALAADAVDLTHGAADLAAFGATDGALRRAAERAGRLARLERRLARRGFAVDAAGVLVAGATAAAVAPSPRCGARCDGVAAVACWRSARWPRSRRRWRWSPPRRAAGSEIRAAGCAGSAQLLGTGAPRTAGDAGRRADAARRRWSRGT